MACGPTSCGMVLDTAGKPVNVTNLAKQANLSKDGTGIRDLERVLSRNGVNARRTFGTDVSIEAIEKATRRGQPAIVRVELQTSKGETYGHFVIVDGVTTRQGGKVVAVRDPNQGRQYFVPVDEFEQKLGGLNRHAIFTNPKMEGKGWIVPR
jgi:filamentous hemagglutinin